MNGNSDAKQEHTISLAINSDILALRDRHLPPLTPRQAAFLVQSLSDSLSADEKQLLSLLSQQSFVAPAIELVQDFAALVRQRQHHLLDAWLQQAIDCSFSALVRFANGLVQDYQAASCCFDSLYQ